MDIINRKSVLHVAYKMTHSTCTNAILQGYIIRLCSLTCPFCDKFSDFILIFRDAEWTHTNRAGNWCCSIEKAVWHGISSKQSKESPFAQ